MNEDDMFQKAYKHFENGEFNKCYILLKILCDKFKNVKINAMNANFILQLYCGYSSVTNALGKPNEYIDKLELFHYSINPELLNHLKMTYCMALLRIKKYRQAKEYMPYLQPVIGPGIMPSNMSYFKKGDINKTLLIYGSGGIGDIFMYTRFMKQICETQSSNNILFFIDDKLYWLFNEAFQCDNLRIIPYSVRDRLNFATDYHINITMLLHMLNLTYETVYVDYYLEKVIGNPINLTDIINVNKKNVIINWSGNKLNIMERYNRSIELKQLIPLFTQFAETINFISIQQSLSQTEIDILNKYNIKNCGQSIDKDGDAFKDSITILRAADIVISTDTSLVHLAGTMNLKCWCLLTFGCDWRWVGDDNKWYPKVKLLRQQKVSIWDNVISELAIALSNI